MKKDISTSPQAFILGGTSNTTNNLAVSLQLLVPPVIGNYVLNDLSVVSDKSIRVYFVGTKNNTGFILKYDESSSNSWSEEVISASYPGNWELRSIDMYTTSLGYAVGGTIGTSSIPVIVKYSSNSWTDFIPTIQPLTDGAGFSGVSFGSDTKGYFAGNRIVGTNNEGIMVFIR